MIHTLIQRGIRKGLRERGWQLPYHRNKPSNNISAKFLYELFRNVTVQTIRMGGESDKRIFGTDEHTAKALAALDVSASAYTPVLARDEK